MHLALPVDAPKRGMTARLASPPPAPSARFVRLRDDRRLAFDDVGDPDGVPILYFHGNGHCRLGRHPDDRIAQRLGVRLVAVDRPGCGRSSSWSARRLADWGADISQLADALGVERFGVLAWSSGGPYAAACAHALPERVSSVAVVSGLAPMDLAGTRGVEPGARLMLQISKLSSRAVLGPLGLMRAGVLTDTDRFISLLFAASPRCDRVILRQPEIRAMFIAAYREAIRNGARSMAHDVSLMPRPWGFSLEDVTAPVALYHGDLDNLAPLRMGRFVAEQLPNATLKVFAGEGHQLLWPRWEEILGALASAARKRSNGPRV